MAEPVYAATHILNGYGELIGVNSIGEWGILESPILLTSSLLIGKVYDATVHWIARAGPRRRRGGHAVRDRVRRLVALDVLADPIDDEDVVGRAGRRERPIRSKKDASAPAPGCSASTSRVGSARRRVLDATGRLHRRCARDDQPRRSRGPARSTASASANGSPRTSPTSTRGVVHRRRRDRCAPAAAPAPAGRRSGPAWVWPAAAPTRPTAAASSCSRSRPRTASRPTPPVRAVRGRRRSSRRGTILRDLPRDGRGDRRGRRQLRCSRAETTDGDGHTLHALPVDRTLELLDEAGRLVALSGSGEAERIEGRRVERRRFVERDRGHQLGRPRAVDHALAPVTGRDDEARRGAIRRSGGCRASSAAAPTRTTASAASASRGTIRIALVRSRCGTDESSGSGVSHAARDDPISAVRVVVRVHDGAVSIARREPAARRYRPPDRGDRVARLGRPYEVADRAARRDRPARAIRERRGRDPDPERLEQTRRPRSGRDHDLICLDLPFVGHHAGHPVAVGHERSRRQVVPDHRPAGRGEQRQRDRERGRIQPVAGVDEPCRRKVIARAPAPLPRARRRRALQRRIPRPTPRPACPSPLRSTPRRRRHEHRADRERVDPDRAAASFVRDLEVTSERSQARSGGAAGPPAEPRVPGSCPDAPAASSSRSTSVTEAPRRVSASAHDAPMMPPPITTTSGTRAA